MISTPSRSARTPTISSRRSAFAARRRGSTSSRSWKRRCCPFSMSASPAGMAGRSVRASCGRRLHVSRKPPRLIVSAMAHDIAALAAEPRSGPPMQGYDIYALGDLRLQSGTVLKDARLAYATYGTLNAAADNAVLLPTFYTGTHIRNEFLFGPGRAIDPARHFVVSVNLFGNGYSSSPSNTDAPQDGPRFPHVTLYDNVACQHRLLTERLGVRRIALVLGWSMAGMQAYQWAAQYPHMVAAILPYCGAARCSPINHAFLDGPKAALQADAVWNNGNYVAPPEKGLRAFGRVYASWAYSHAFFRDGLYRSLGFATL